MYIIICEMNHHPASMQETGCSGLVHWDDPEGWDREGGGRRVRDGGHMYTQCGFCQCMAKPIQYCKVISLQLKLKKKKKEMSCGRQLRNKFPT